ENVLQSRKRRRGRKPERVRGGLSLGWIGLLLRCSSLLSLQRTRVSANGPADWGLVVQQAVTSTCPSWRWAPLTATQRPFQRKMGIHLHAEGLIYMCGR